VAVVTLTLNLSQLFFFEPLHLWVRIGVPVLLVTGFLGSVLRSKSLRFVGWIGICYFVPYALTGSIPGEDYRFGGPGYPPITNAPHLVGWLPIFWRLALMLLLSASLIVCFRKLAVPINVYKASTDAL
jgi:hypothetical protein